MSIFVIILVSALVVGTVRLVRFLELLERDGKVKSPVLTVAVAIVVVVVVPLLIWALLTG